jgi:hypothetical protein
MCKRDMKFLSRCTSRTQRNQATPAHTFNIEVPDRTTFVYYDIVDRQLETRSYRL